MTISAARRPRAACALRIEPAACTWSSKVLSGATPTIAPASPSRRTAVSSRGASSSSLTMRCPRLRRGRPVHAPKRLSLLVVAHRVEVEAGRPAEEKPAPFERARPGVREERIEVDEPRVDEHGLARGQRDLDLLEAERVLEHRLRGLDRIPAARDRVEDVRATQAAVAAENDGLDLPELRDLLDDRERARGHAAADVDLEPDGDVVPGEMLSLAQRAVDPHRPVEEPHPEGRGRHREHEAEPDRVERRRPERPRRKVDSAAEGEDPAAAVGQHVPAPPALRRGPVFVRGSTARDPRRRDLTSGPPARGSSGARAPSARRP